MSLTLIAAAKIGVLYFATYFIALKLVPEYMVDTEIVNPLLVTLSIIIFIGLAIDYILVLYNRCNDDVIYDAQHQTLFINMSEYRIKKITCIETGGITIYKFLTYDNTKCSAFSIDADSKLHQHLQTKKTTNNYWVIITYILIFFTAVYFLYTK